MTAGPVPMSIEGSWSAGARGVRSGMIAYEQLVPELSSDDGSPSHAGLRRGAASCGQVIVNAMD
jgi:hypothetical protein